MVETIIAAIIAGVSAGATAGVKDAVKDGLANAYGELKSAITGHAAHNNEISSALTQLEAKPTSVARQSVVKEELEASGLGADALVLEKANVVLSLLSTPKPDSSVSQVAHGTGIAQADQNSSASVTMTQTQN